MGAIKGVKLWSGDYSSIILLQVGVVSCVSGVTFCGGVGKAAHSHERIGLNGEVVAISPCARRVFKPACDDKEVVSFHALTRRWEISSWEFHVHLVTLSTHHKHVIGFLHKWSYVAIAGESA